MIKAVLIGTAHMHVNEIALYLHEQPDFEIVGAADVPPVIPEQTQARYTRNWNLQHISGCFHIPVYIDYCQMLDQVKPDIAFLLCENSRKVELARECAVRKISLCIEKPMALNYAQAQEIVSCAEENHVELVVNWPTTWRPYVHTMVQALEHEVVGRPRKLRYLNGHTGPLGPGARHRGITERAEEMTDAERVSTWWYRKECGGGVLLDIMCYGAMYAQWIMGTEPEHVAYTGSNLNTPFGSVDDNASALLTYQEAQAVLEGTWSAPRCVIPSGPMVLCERGVVLCTGRSEDGPGVAVYDLQGNEIPVPEADFPFRNMAWQYAHHIRTGEPVHQTLTPAFNLQVMKLLDRMAGC